MSPLILRVAQAQDLIVLRELIEGRITAEMRVSNPTPSLRHSPMQDECRRSGEGPHLQSSPNLTQAMDISEIYSLRQQNRKVVMAEKGVLLEME